jgi:OmpA-OmpF porin, OOP family
MHKHIAPILTAVFVATTALAGCKASFKAGGDDKPAKAAPPPPAPAPAPAPEPAPAKPKVKFKMKGEQLELPGPVVFETGSDQLKPESDAVLNIVHDYMKSTDKVTLLRIEGHTDSDGDDASNLDLSKRRSMSVARWLTGKGIDCKRLLPVGFGESKPIAENATPDGKAQNRRTAFVNAALAGKPIGGMPVDGGGTSAGDPCS